MTPRHWLSAGLGLTMLLGCQSRLPELDGSWFVRYHSDPRPYLDVAFRGSQPRAVTAVLSGPAGFRESLALTWNPKDEEWQHVPTHLPDPLPGGTWWVSAIEADTARGPIAWSSPRPATPYARTNQDREAPSPVTPGFFYSPEPGPRRVRIETLGPTGGRQADPILAVFAEGEDTHWLAALDDYDVDEAHPTLVLPVTEGVPYFVRITGAEDDAGHYAIRVVDEAVRRMARPTEVAAFPDVYEPDEGPAAATALPIDVVLHRSLGARDVDWMRFVVPPGLTPTPPTPAPAPAAPDVRTPPGE